jgi:hypothetical protein
MKNKLDTMVVLFPVMSVLVIVLIAGGLGTIFSVIHETTHSEVGVIILGVALVVGVPALAALAQKRMERE